ncbi:MAG: DCC1-like thiol-disulfide oxidoreductase family protein [Gloeomargarita sp. SKYBB_i_bin120]|nr:DCC1-like thiol-disulfide oxidoreductase family protein [Gloeomargarita sp. SKYG98]MCS7293334.1 DCC1-like thiol-disulfide oxidoreductase family protein [Gloeomargarita sp. SKYB120]MDW8178899.1 DCC1-like thiol-disulfide oxidoreductase family protein [Gloeomargarita sp. SKYBB_i_bin120]
MPSYLIIYDGRCRLCSGWVAALYTLEQGRWLRYLPMQDETALAAWGVTPADCDQGVILIDGNQPERRWQGTAALEQLATLIPGMEPLVALYQQLPGLKALGDACYAQIRDHRYEWFGTREEVYRVPAS